MKKILIYTLILFCGVSIAQKRKAPQVTGVIVKYKGGSVLKVIGAKAEFVPVMMERRREAGQTPRESTFVDYSKMEYYQMAVMPDGEKVTMVNPFEYNKNMKVIRNEKLDKWDCKVAQTSVNSNTIEIWYVDNLGFSGAPMPAWGAPEGVVLKIVRNGNTMMEAESVENITQDADLFPDSWGKITDAVEYRYMLNNFAVKTVEVFNDERISFTDVEVPTSFDKDNYVYHVGGGTIILKKVKLPDNVEKQSIFAEVSQYSDGDAYDRTGSIFVVPVGKEKSYLDAMSNAGINSLPAFISDTISYPGLISTADYDVPVEIMRFFTSFGVRGFNHIKVKGQSWADSVIYKSDVTHLANLLKGEAWIGAYIGNWDSKGHKLSLKLKYHPGGRGSSERIVMPLFNTLNILEQAGQKYPVFFGNNTLKVNIDIQEDLKNVQLVYLTTGHGGWGGGDEFNQKLNTIRMDDEKIFSFIPWREDCASYRNWNPASGNFNNGLSSSDLSRSNWCPGTVTYPVYVPIGDLRKGKHTFDVHIPQGEPSGNSISYWCISGFLVAEK